MIFQDSRFRDLLPLDFVELMGDSRRESEGGLSIEVGIRHPTDRLFGHRSGFLLEASLLGRQSRPAGDLFKSSAKPSGSSGPIDRNDEFELPATFYEFIKFKDRENGKQDLIFGQGGNRHLEIYNQISLTRS